MSRSIKMIIAGLCLALASASTASAQISQMRLFSPFPDDQFGGGVYQHEGFYGSIGAGIVSITQPGDQVVGKIDGTTQFVTNVFPGDGNQTYFNYAAQTSQINTSQLHASWETATEFTVGNVIGHHGWELKGTVVSPQETSYSGQYGGINIEDPACVNVSSFQSLGNANYYVWVGGANPVQAVNDGSMYQIGRLWAVRAMNNTGTSGNVNTGTGTQGNTSATQDNYMFVPIPITYETFSMTSKVNTYSVEAMYNYRFHPFRRGMLEALAGVRYTEFDGTFNFFGHANTKNTSSYEITDTRILSNTVTDNSGGSSTTSSGQSYQSNTTNNENTVGADLGYSDWNFEAQNHIIGPQVGLRYTLSNNRWRFSGETKYFAGFNRQNIYGDGTFGLKAMGDTSNNGNNTTSGTNNNQNNSATGGVPTYAPLNTIANSFAYSRHYDEFTNGIESKIEASWNWTQAIGFKVGYQMMYMDEIARASAVNDYKVNADGSLFGVKENKSDRNFDQFVHGVMFTVLVNR